MEKFLHLWRVKESEVVVERKDLKEFLLETGGRVMINGRLRGIKSKHLGAGVYRVTIDYKED